MRKKGDLSNFEILTPNHLAPTAMPFRNVLSKGFSQRIINWIYTENVPTKRASRNSSGENASMSEDNGQIALN